MSMGDMAPAFAIAVPFGSVVAAIKIITDARFRSRLIGTEGASEMVRAFLEAEQTRRRLASLRWGLVLAALALGLGLIEAFGWREFNAGVAAVLLGATAIGNLAYFFSIRAMGLAKAESP